MLSVGKVLPQTLEIGLACAGLGFGTVMPSVIKAVIGSIDQRDAGLASGIVITTFQVGAALGDHQRRFLQRARDAAEPGCLCARLHARARLQRGATYVERRAVALAAREEGNARQNRHNRLIYRA
jgi:hypothetical protein